MDKISIKDKDKKEFTLEIARAPQVTVLSLATVEQEIQTMEERETFLQRQIETCQNDLKNIQDHKKEMEDTKKEMEKQLKTEPVLGGKKKK